MCLYTSALPSGLPFGAPSPARSAPYLLPHTALEALAPFPTPLGLLPIAFASNIRGVQPLPARNTPISQATPLLFSCPKPPNTINIQEKQHRQNDPDRSLKSKNKLVPPNIIAPPKEIFKRKESKTQIIAGCYNMYGMSLINQWFISRQCVGVAPPEFWRCRGHTML